MMIEPLPPNFHTSNCQECLQDGSGLKKEYDWSFVPIAVCISLKDREDRVLEATRQFHNVGLCKTVVFYRPEKDKSNVRRPGTRGCWESHRHVAQIVRDEWKLDNILIFEDDVYFDDNTTPERIKSLEKSFYSLPDDWNLYHIGHWSLLSIPYKKNIVRTVSLCTHAYFMNKRMMDWVANHPFDRTLFAPKGGFGIDCYFAKAPKVYAFFPMLAYQSGSPSSNPKPKLGGKALDFALSNTKFMNTSQYVGIGASVLIFAIIIVIVIVVMRSISKMGDRKPRKKDAFKKNKSSIKDNSKFNNSK